MITTGLWLIIFIYVLYRHRQWRIDLLRREAHGVQTAEEIINVLQPGDVVYMASRKLGWGLHSLYAVMSSIVLRTPLYHVFIVVDKGAVAHFVHDAYQPHLTRVCAGNIEMGNLKFYLNYRRSTDPLMTVFRRESGKMNMPEDARSLCDLRFMKTWDIALSVLFPWIKFERHKAHCNSFLGLLLERKGWIPPTDGDHNQRYIPSNMINKYLPLSGFHRIGMYYFRPSGGVGDDTHETGVT